MQIKGNYGDGTNKINQTTKLNSLMEKLKKTKLDNEPLIQEKKNEFSEDEFDKLASEFMEAYENCKSQGVDGKDGIDNSNAVTNTIVETQLVTNTEVVTNTVIETNLIDETNTQCITNTEVVTNTIVETQLITNTEVVTNTVSSEEPQVQSEANSPDKYNLNMFRREVK